MLVKGSMVTEMSGSIGGITAARNKGGLYMRARSTPVNPNSPAQQSVRTALAALVTAWIETLSSAQRQSWADYAANVTVTNPLGDATTISGQNWYIALNTPRIQNSLDRVDDAPATYDGATLNPVALGAATGNLFSIDFDDTQAWTAEDGAALIVQASRPQNPTKVFFKGPFQIAGTIDGDSTTAPTSPGTVSSPFTYAAGQVAIARIRLSLADGRLSAPQIVRAIAS